LIPVSELIRPLRLVRGRIFYGWFMVGLGALVGAVGTVPLFQGMPIWNPVLRSFFGWSTGQLTWAFVLTRVEGGILGPVEGILVERLGSRRMVLTGMSVLGGGFILFSQVHELWQLYGVFFMMSLGAALGTWLPMMTVLNHWFARKKSRAMGLAFEGYAIGGIALVPLIAWAVGGIGEEGSGGENFGWRAVTAGIGVVVMLMALPISRLVRNRPEDIGLHPDGDTPPPTPATAYRTETARPSAADPGFTWQEAIRTRAFWLMSIGHAATATVIVTVMVHMGLMLTDRDFSLQEISLVVATYVAINAVFILIGGYIGDRMPIRFAIFGFSAIQSASLIVILLAHTLPMAFLFAVILGIGFGGRIPLTTAIRGVYFGRRGFASITGISTVPMNVVVTAAALFAAYINYNISFTTVAIVSLFGSIFFLMMGPPRPPSPRTRAPSSETAVEYQNLHSLWDKN